MSKWTTYTGKIFDCKNCGMTLGWKKAKSGKYYAADVFSVDKSPVFQLTGSGKGFVAYHRCTEEAQSRWQSVTKQSVEKELVKEQKENSFNSEFAKECAEYVVEHAGNADMYKGTVHEAYFEAKKHGLTGLGKTEVEAIENLHGEIEAKL